MPADAPTAFIKPRWAKLVLTDEGIDRALLRVMRAVGIEERAALGRRMGARLAPVQRLRRILGASREVHHPELATNCRWP